MQTPTPEPPALPSALLARWSRLGASLGAREKVERTRLVLDRARSQMLAYVREPSSRPGPRAAYRGTSC
jgi:hypothetical protein